MDHETRFAVDQQRATVDDAREFVRHMASPDLFDTLDMDSIMAAEGNASKSNLRMHTTRLITEHSQRMMNKILGAELYSEEEISSLYRQAKRQRIDDSDEQKAEKEAIHTFGEQYKAFREYERMNKEKLMCALAPSEPITDADIDREIITIRTAGSPFRMKIRIDNYVFVTYLCNKGDTNKRCKINLLDMAAKTQMFGIQHSKNKFSKNDLRYRWGSHLIFESGVLVETGSTNPLLAAKLLEHTMNIFRTVCGYHDIGIWERRCDNVVATMSLDFDLRLELLKNRYPYVTYEKDDFAGAIIRINEIDMYGGATPTTDTTDSLTSTIFDNTEEYINHERQRTNIAEEYNRKYNDIGSEADQRERDMIQRVLSSSGTNYEAINDDFDISNILRNPKEKNVKALVFPYGRVICVGNKSREGVIESYTKLYPILLSVRDTPENLKEEARIIRLRRQNVSRKRHPTTPATTD